MMNMDRLESLITMVQRGDLDAFEAIVRRFRGMVYASAYSMLDDAHLAEDVAQETFIEAYLNLSKLREPAAFAGWLRHIVFKQADRLLRAKHVYIVPLEPGIDFDLPAEDLNPALLIEDRERQGVIHQTIAALPEQERIVILLFYSSGYSIKEIAEFMEASPGAIKKRLYDARKRLQSGLLESTKDILHEMQNTRRRHFSALVRLLIAVRLGDDATVKAIIERNPMLINSRMTASDRAASPLMLSIGHTALHEAAAHGCTSIARLLLAYGASVDARRRDGATPLHEAVLSHHSEMVEMLLKHNANVNATCYAQMTPLHHAAMKGYCDCAELLLSYGAAVNARARSGRTLLHWAALKGYRDIVQLLLRSGADTLARDELGRTPLEWARAREQQAVVEMLTPDVRAAPPRKGEGLFL
jgi:RNA polymerase sigma factor (sigma-70 family)